MTNQAPKASFRSFDSDSEEEDKEEKPEWPGRFNEDDWREDR